MYFELLLFDFYAQKKSKRGTCSRTSETHFYKFFQLLAQVAQVALNEEAEKMKYFFLHYTLLVPLVPITDNLIFLLKLVVPLVPILEDFHRGLETVI